MYSCVHVIWHFDDFLKKNHKRLEKRFEFGENTENNGLNLILRN